VKGLVLCGGRDVAVDRQIREKLFDFWSAHRMGMTQAVKADKACHPFGKAVFGAWRVLAHPASMSQAIEQARRFGEGQLADSQAEHVLLKKGQRRVRLFEAVEGIFLGVGDVFEESAHVAGRQLAWMAFIVKENEPASPVGVAFCGSVLVKACERDLADEVEEARG
jgi:hypothetical protein